MKVDRARGDPAEELSPARGAQALSRIQEAGTRLVRGALAAGLVALVLVAAATARHPDVRQGGRSDSFRGT